MENFIFCVVIVNSNASNVIVNTTLNITLNTFSFLHMKLRLMGGAMKHFLKSLLGHENLRSMVLWVNCFLGKSWNVPRLLLLVPLRHSIYFCSIKYRRKKRPFWKRSLVWKMYQKNFASPKFIYYLNITPKSHLKIFFLVSG